MQSQIQNSVGKKKSTCEGNAAHKHYNEKQIFPVLFVCVLFLMQIIQYY